MTFLGYNNSCFNLLFLLFLKWNRKHIGKFTNKIMFSNQKPSIYEFHSTPHSYQGKDEPDLRLELYEYGADALEVRLINRDLPQQKKNMKKHITLFMLASGFHLWLHLNRIVHVPYVDIFLGLWCAILMWRLSHLVEYGTCL